MAADHGWRWSTAADRICWCLPRDRSEKKKKKTAVEKLKKRRKTNLEHQHELRVSCDRYGASCGTTEVDLACLHFARRGRERQSIKVPAEGEGSVVGSGQGTGVSIAKLRGQQGKWSIFIYNSSVVRGVPLLYIRFFGLCIAILRSMWR